MGFETIVCSNLWLQAAYKKFTRSDVKRLYSLVAFISYLVYSVTLPRYYVSED